MDKRLCGHQGLSGGCGEEKNLLPLPGIEPRRSRLKPAFILGYRGSPDYVYVLDKDMNNMKRNKEVLLEASTETGLMEMYTTMRHRQISRGVITDPLKKVQVFGNDSDKSKTD
jgi:hypothetical protein